MQSLVINENYSLVKFKMNGDKFFQIQVMWELNGTEITASSISVDDDHDNCYDGESICNRVSTQARTLDSRIET